MHMHVAVVLECPSYITVCARNCAGLRVAAVGRHLAPCPGLGLRPRELPRPSVRSNALTVAVPRMICCWAVLNLICCTVPWPSHRRHLDSLAEHFIWSEAVVSRADKAIGAAKGQVREVFLGHVVLYAAAFPTG
jgi:hypothetical protein